MTAQSPAFVLQNSSHSAALFRQAAFSPWFRPGVISPTELVVAAQASPNMSVQVAGGRAWMLGTQVSNVSGQSFATQAAYFGLNDASVSLTIAASDPTNPRIDIVVAYVQDAFYSGAVNAFTLGVVTGTPAASPAAPAAPNNALTLAQVAVAANATQIVSGNITVTPIGTLLATARGGIAPVQSTDVVAGGYVDQYRGHPTWGLQRWDGSAWRDGGVLYVATESTLTGTTPPTGTVAYSADTKSLGVYDSVKGWLFYDTVAQTYTPTLGGGVAIGAGGVNTGAYTRAGKRVHLSIALNLGTSGYNVGTTTWTWSLPTGVTCSTTSGDVWLPAYVSAGSYTSGAAYAYPNTASTLRASVPTSSSAVTSLNNVSPAPAASEQVIIHGFIDNQS